MNQPSIICFGEVLWDCLPKGLFLGGAPCNVAYHLARHGAQAAVVTAVGDDFLGREVVERLARWGINSKFVHVYADLPTGTVQVDLLAGGPAYTIVEGVAWDAIPVGDELVVEAALASAVVYGSLALRTEGNREAAARLLDSAAGWKVLDINLRPPFIERPVIEFALDRADLVKLNDDELFILTASPDTSSREPSAVAECAAAFADSHRLKRLCVTCGARGAGLLWDGNWYWEGARPVEVHDTVGAGDAFLAALLVASLRGDSPADALAAASRMGELVAGSDGATPEY